MRSMPLDLVTVRTYRDRLGAELDQARLEAYGIASMVAAEDCGGTRLYLMTGLGDARLLVPRERAEEARQLLEPPAETPVRRKVR
jgi:hypothetical protein